MDAVKQKNLFILLGVGVALIAAIGGLIWSKRDNRKGASQKMTQNDHSDVYIIPPNFVRDGTLFSGRAEARNVVEAAFLALVGIRF